MTLEQLVIEARRLRESKERSAAEFFVFLWRAENGPERAWSAAGATFDEFLRSYRLCQSTSYRNFVAGLERLGGPEQALAAGAEATMEARKLQTAEAAERFVEVAMASHEVHGVYQSAEAAQREIARLEPKAPTIVRQVSELSRLRAENQRLRAELAEAKKKHADEVKSWRSRAEKAERALLRAKEAAA